MISICFWHDYDSWWPSDHIDWKLPLKCLIFPGAKRVTFLLLEWCKTSLEIERRNFWLEKYFFRGPNDQNGHNRSKCCERFRGRILWRLGNHFCQIHPLWFRCSTSFMLWFILGWYTIDLLCIDNSISKWEVCMYILTLTNDVNFRKHTSVTK